MKEQKSNEQQIYRVRVYKDFDFPSDVLNISLEFDWRSKGVSCSGCLDFGSLVVYNLPNDYPLPNEFNLSDVFCYYKLTLLNPHQN